MDIIIASANVFRLELSAFVLVEAGYQIRECHTIHEVLGAIMQRAPDVLLIDQAMFYDLDNIRVRLLVQQHNVSVVTLITRPQATLMLPEQAGDYVLWPYQPADLLAHMQTFRMPMNVAVSP